MNSFLTILAMVFIGAFHGGFGNWLAIKMLFRPYRAKYIGKWRIPFTPGMIPKRQKEMASSLGDIVVEHLLTPEGIKKKIDSDSFKHELNQFVREKLLIILESDETVGDILQKHTGVNLKEKIMNLLSSSSGRKISDIFPSSLFKKVEEMIPHFSDFILKKSVQYFESPAGKENLRTMLDNFLSEQGFFTNMFVGFMGKESLVQKGQFEIIAMLNRPSVYLFLSDSIKSELEKLKEKDVSDFSLFFNAITEHLEKHIFNSPLNDLIGNHKEKIINAVLFSVEKARTLLSERLDFFFKQMNLSTIVREQVEGFPVERLEEMFKSITEKELKAIIYFGAFLGAWIGLFQGLLILFRI